MSRENKLFWAVALIIFLCLLAGLVSAGIVPTRPKIFKPATVTQGLGAAELIAPAAKPPAPKALTLSCHFKTNDALYPYTDGTNWFCLTNIATLQVKDGNDWRTLCQTSGTSFTVQANQKMQWFRVSTNEWKW